MGQFKVPAVARGSGGGGGGGVVDPSVPLPGAARSSEGELPSHVPPPPATEQHGVSNMCST